ncbi:MAG: tetratricopeptide repeat protein [Pseudomonadota bacterium]
MVQDFTTTLADAPAAGGGSAIIDVTIETFEKDVIEASMSMPVIVDFWATWCQPCKTLTPVLEKHVTAAGGAVRLAKVDIDKNQMLASQLRIQSVPTVYAFFQGRPVDGFQGALPDSEVKAFIERLTSLPGAGGPAGAPDFNEILTAAEAALADGQAAEAADAFAATAEAVGPEQEDIYARALGGLARCRIALGDTDGAQQVFEMVPEARRDDPAIADIAARLALASSSVEAGEAAALAAAADADPNNLDAAFALAEALIGAGDMAAGMDRLLSIIERDRDWNEGAARQKLLTVFDALGPTDALTLKGRRRLSSLLFS